jgi:hypothetical protein
MGSSTSTLVESGTNGKCPYGFTRKTVSSFFGGDSYTCIPPSSGSAFNNAVPVGQKHATNGYCTNSASDTNPPPAPSCNSGYTSVGTYDIACCAGSLTSCGGSDITGYREQRICKENGGRKIFQLYNKPQCKSVFEGEGAGSWGFHDWCNRSSGRDRENYCWLPYHMNSNLQCYPHNYQQIGAFSSTGLVANVNQLIDIEPTGAVTNNFTPPPPYHTPLNTGRIALVGGGSVAGAAIIGLAIFNKKKKMKELPKEAELSNASVV